MPRSLVTLVFILPILFASISFPLRSQIVEGLVNIRFQLDVRVFSVMAAINGSGFDLDAANLVENPTRQVVRQRLLQLDSSLRNRLREFYRTRDFQPDPAKQQSRYLSFSLCLNGPPDFGLAVKPEHLPEEAKPLLGFENLVKELWEKGELSKLWAEVQPHYLEEAQAYRPLIRRTILDCLRFMRTEARVALDRQVVFIPDLLNGYGIVNARNVGENYFLVVGPSRTKTKSIRSVRHEYLHFMIDPLVTKYVGYLPEPEPFLKLVGQRPQVLPQYKSDFLLMVAESVIHMMELRLDAVTAESKKMSVVADYDEGLILTPYVDESLERFEKAQGSFQEFFLQLVQGIRVEIEGNRPDSIVRWKSEIADRRARIQSESEALEQAKGAIREMLVRANDLLMAQKFSQARPIVEEVLRRDPGNTHALFAMAQLASRDQDLDRALELYQQAAAKSGENAWIAAWCFVRRGNIYQFLGDLVRARQEWSRVGELKGDLRGASEAAAKALAATKP